MRLNTPRPSASLCACQHALGAVLGGMLLSHFALAQQPSAENDYQSSMVFSEAEEAEYLSRYEIAISRSRPADLYRPVAALPGTEDWYPLPAAQVAQRSISAAAIEDAIAYAADNNSSALIVWRGGRVEAEKYFGDTTRSSLINSFSLAKPITALAVGRAIALGAIRSLDQPAADYFEEWRDDPRRSKVLVRHLLDMRPGFLRQGSGEGPNAVMSRSFLHPRSDEILLREYPVVHEPGTRFEYNNAASAVVAILIERATGRKYREFVGTEILKALGAPGGTVWVNRKKDGVAQAGCCIMLPAESYLRLGLLVLQEGRWEGKRLLSADYVREMLTPTEENPYYGLGVYVAGRYTERRGWANPDLGLPQVLHSEPYLATDLVLFDGNMNQVVYIIPSQELVILRTGRMPPRNEEREWDNAYLPNVIMRGIQRDKGESVPQPR
jgi:CubicO group peptidase (beta-lactamase class C family)